jgi:hypothetical protein
MSVEAGSVLTEWLAFRRRTSGLSPYGSPVGVIHDTAQISVIARHVGERLVSRAGYDPIENSRGELRRFLIPNPYSRIPGDRRRSRDRAISSASLYGVTRPCPWSCTRASQTRKSRVERRRHRGRCTSTPWDHLDRVVEFGNFKPEGGPGREIIRRSPGRVRQRRQRRRTRRSLGVAGRRHVLRWRGSRTPHRACRTSLRCAQAR